MPRHIFTQDECRRGGLAVKGRKPPDVCRCGCGRRFFRHWHAYLGHLGFVAYACKHHSGDTQAALRYVQALGQAATDPFPQNGAFARAHALVAAHERREVALTDPQLPEQEVFTPRPAECPVCGRRIPGHLGYCSHECEEQDAHPYTGAC